MLDVFAVVVGLLAILQFLIKTEKWSVASKILTCIILGGVSVFIFSFNNSSAKTENAAVPDNVGSIESTTFVESYNTSSQDLETAAITNPPTSATTTPEVQSTSNVTDGQPYSIHRSEKVVSLKRGKHYPYICNPEINNCLGFTMKFSYQLQGGNYAKNVWLVCVRENGDEWVEVDQITINEGEEKEFVIRFDRAISFTEIVIQKPIDYNNYMHTDSLSIYDIVYN